MQLPYDFGSAHLTPELVILLSGHVSVGKTTLARELASGVAGDAEVFSSRAVLERRLRSEAPDRRSLQILGESLDRETEGRWLSDALWESAESGRTVIVDAVRIKDQVTAFERRPISLLHVHLRASALLRQERYAERQRRHPDTELLSYRDVLDDPTEAAVDDMATAAAIVLDTGRLSVPACQEIVLAAAIAMGALERG
jgi:adenylosuccinate synthase